MAATSTPSASPSPSPSPSATPSAEESKEDEAEQPQEAEEPTEAAPPPPSYPDDGWYQVKQEASGLCLSTGPEPGNEGRTVVVLAGCGSANPSTIQVVAWDEGVYVFNLHFSDWSACMGADAPDAVARQAELFLQHQAEQFEDATQELVRQTLAAPRSLAWS